jgi:outer membrane murein-binding lipoprotein Lpp
MAFLFDCPHCTQSFEAELDLCGSTCNCPSCGELFLVPELDAEAVLQLKREAALQGKGSAKEKSTTGKRLGKDSEASALRDDGGEASETGIRERVERAIAEERTRLETRIKAAETAADAAEKRTKAMLASEKTIWQSETDRLMSSLQQVEAQRMELEASLSQERERLEGQLAALQTALSVAVERANLAEETAKFGSDVPRLRSELERLSVQKTASEKELAEAYSKLEAKVGELEQDRESLLKQIGTAQTELAEAHKQVTEANSEIALLKARLEQDSKSGIAPTPAKAQDAELLETLARRDATIEKLMRQVQSLSVTDSSSMSFPAEKSAFSLLGNPISVGILTLGLGLAIGWMSSRSAYEPTSPSQATSAALSAKAGSPEVTQGKENKENKEKNQSAGTAVATRSATEPVVPTVAPLISQQPSPETGAPDAAKPNTPEGTASVQSNASTPALTAGLPSHLPDSFLGLKFGMPLMDVTARGQWQETSGKRHRKAELLGAGVEAVLTPDDLDHLVMGSYVRVAARQPESLSPFLEWAVNVQDAVSALYGQPSRMHQISGATEATEVVRKISSGEDFYEAAWERDGDDTTMTLSIRVFNERSVVFRLEYRSRELTTAALERQAAAAERTAAELGKDTKEGTPGKPAPQTVKESVSEEKAAPAKAPEAPAP